MAENSFEKWANQISMITLLAAGVFFIFEGIMLINMHKENPRKVPSKIMVAGGLTIFLGGVSIAFAILHLFIDKFISHSAS